MGDSRYERHLSLLLEQGAGALGELADDELIQALAALAARQGGKAAYVANFLATEAMNRLARAHAVAMHSTIGLVGVDVEGATLFANPAAVELLGWTQGDLRGVHIHTLLHPQDAQCPLQASLEGGAPRHERSTFTRKDGSTLRVEFSTAAYRRDGVDQGVVLAFHPIAEDGRSITGP